MAKEEISKEPDNTGKIRDKQGRFKPGVSGNPNGKPPGSISITAKIKKELETIPEGQKITYLDALVKKILKKAIADEDHQMIKTIWEHIDGSPRQTTEHVGDIHISKIISVDE